MELELTRVDYAAVGLTGPRCMRLVPGALPRQQQKVAVGDQDGVLQVFSVRREDVQIHFKTLPGGPVSSVRCGGADGTAHDKIFVSSGNEVRGYTRKGKLFLSFDTNMTEPITCMYVHGADLILCGRHVYCHYRDCKDVGSYLCGDSILDVVALPTDRATQRLTSIIACEGRMLRILEHSRVIHSIDVGSSPVVLHAYVAGADVSRILFGTVDGKVGVLDIDTMQISHRWLLDAADAADAAVSCLDHHDMTGDGVPDLLVGRRDGTVQVYAVNVADAADPPRLLFSHGCGESVTALQGGVVGRAGRDELLVCTYAGRVFGLAAGAPGDGGDSADAGQRAARLRADVADLEARVARERDRYQAATQALSLGVSAIPALPLRDWLLLDRRDASYSLVLEAPAAIDNVLLQSDVPLDLLDVDRNSAVVSRSDCERRPGGSFLLVAFRCQVNTCRLEARVRTVEGQHGTLQAYVTPLVQPRCCQLRRFHVRPLSLHTRCHAFDDKRPFNVLALRGAFSLAELHSWVRQCFPEVPDKPALADRTVLTFQSVFTDTVVQCTYWKGEAEFKSDNVSTVSILKEFLTMQATKKKIRLEISTSVDDKSVAHTLRLLHPKLTECMQVARKLTVLRALRELDVHEDENVNYLTPKYRQLLSEERACAQQDSARPAHLDRLFGCVTDLYVDYHKFKGENVRARVPELLRVLEDYDYDSTLAFIQSQ